MHTVEMTPQEQEQAVQKARDLAEHFARLGPTADKDNSFAYDSAPLFKESGLGREKGLAGMRLYQQTKAIYLGLEE